MLQLQFAAGLGHHRGGEEEKLPVRHGEIRTSTLRLSLQSIAQHLYCHECHLSRSLHFGHANQSQHRERVPHFCCHPCDGITQWSSWNYQQFQFELVIPSLYFELVHGGLGCCSEWYQPVHWEGRGELAQIFLPSRPVLCSCSRFKKSNKLILNQPQPGQWIP